MARDSDQLSGSFETENTGGVLSGFLAEEDGFDRRFLWRLGSWGVASVGAVVVALYANQSSIGLRREQVAAADLARQAQQIQSIARESQNETRRLASAIDTLNGDRDRLYSRVTVLEQGLDSVTGAIARQTAAATVQAPPAPSEAAQSQPAAQNPPPAPPSPAPDASPVATTSVTATAEKARADATVAQPAAASPSGQAGSNAPAEPPTTPLLGSPLPNSKPAATPLVASRSITAPPDPAAAKLIEPEKPAKAVTVAPIPEVVASAPAGEEVQAEASETASAKVAVQRTEFGVEVGGANSVGGLRALWRGLLKSRSNAALTTLRPIIVIREGSNGLGMQLRLVAGPLDDAAAAAKICAGLIAKERQCETTVFDGQRLAMKGDEPAAGPLKPASAKPTARRRSLSKRVVNEEPPKKPDPPPSTLSTSTLSTLFGRR